MNGKQWIRQIHRWLSIAFTVTVIANIVALTMGHEQPDAWVTYSPLPPLAVLLFTGLYLFVLPYGAKWRRGLQTDGRGGPNEEGESGEIKELDR